MDDRARLATREIFRGRVVRLRADRVRLPNGHETVLEIVEHPGAAAVVPVDGDGRVYLVRQYRYAAGGYLLEVPAGKLDGREPPEACARRELEEEVGLTARQWQALGWIWTTPGFTDERIWLYLARELTPVGQKLSRHEVLSVERMPLAEAARLARAGEIADAKSVCALLRAAARLGV